jgi:hypothetical protein
MHINITTEEITEELPKPAGFLRNLQKAKTRPAWDVQVRVTFSEEEKAIIERHNLRKRTIYVHKFPLEQLDRLVPESRRHALSEYDVKVEDFMEGTWKGCFHMTWYTPWDAKKYVEELRSNILPMLKDYLTVNRTVGSSDSFEL